MYFYEAGCKIGYEYEGLWLFLNRVIHRFPLQIIIIITLVELVFFLFFFISVFFDLIFGNYFVWFVI